MTAGSMGERLVDTERMSAPMSDRLFPFILDNTATTARPGHKLYGMANPS